MKRTNRPQLAFLFALLTTSLAHAAVTASTGAVVLNTSPPSNIISGNWESDTQIREFTEAQPKTLTQPVNVDVTVPGTSPSATDDNLSPVTLPVGTMVNSYFLHFDPVGKPAAAVTVSGSITFDNPVLGLIALSSTLNSSIASLGLAGTTYASGSDHGMDLSPIPGPDGTNDILTLSPDGSTVSFTISSRLNADELRIVTAVPEPASASLLALSCVHFLTRRPRRLGSD